VLAGGGALALAFPEPSLGPLAWVALAPLLVAAPRLRTLRAALLGGLYGVVFFGVLIFWISIIGYVGWVLLVALQASFLAAFGAAWARCARLARPWARALVAPALWVTLEYLRARIPLGGFTWGQLAQSQNDAGALLRVASLTGGWGVAFLVVAANALIAEAWTSWRDRAGPHALLWLGAAAACLAWPGLLPANDASGKRLDVAIVQGGTSESLSRLGPRQASILASHARLTERLAPGVDLVVWPESSVELDLPTSPSPIRVLARSARAANAHIIAGVNDDVGERRYKVMAFLVTPRGRVAGVYQKNHLVPFGEYIPNRKLLDWIPMLTQVPKDAIPGTRPGVFDLGDYRVATVISFEGDFGSLARVPVAKGGRLLVVATNTSTWERSWASAQHLAFSQVRAAENGVWVVHGAISGISAFVAPDGSVTASTPLGPASTLTRGVRLARSTTFYARAGDWLLWLCGAVALLGLALAPRRRRSRGR
jgi:apolipoprotein N-acyltransferase